MSRNLKIFARKIYLMLAGSSLSITIIHLGESFMLMKRNHLPQMKTLFLECALCLVIMAIVVILVKWEGIRNPQRRIQKGYY